MFRKRRTIYLSGNNTGELSGLLDNVPANTKHLWIQGFYPFPKSVTLDQERLFKLRSLCLLNIEFEEFPTWVFNFQELKSLTIRGNFISKIPKELIGLKHLKSLRIENCDLDEGPEFLRQMDQLKKLSFTANFQLKEINPSFLPSRLKVFNCTPSGISSKGLNNLKNARPGIKY